MTLFPWACLAAVLVVLWWGARWAESTRQAAYREAALVREHEAKLLDRTLSVEKERIAAKKQATAARQKARADRVQLQEREIAVKERDIAVKERVTTPPTPMPPLPSDIQSLVRTWDDDWAKNDMEKVITETWGRSQDWNDVRQALAPWLPRPDAVER